ncbi:leucine-rich repeat domain-containing protein [Microscilla marina]|uniref:Leucine-rich repeat containing protein n=1 Tax=Microscilla marina ATCC 23134 TaxID=313606 RepID=A2A0H8_MICM2|nr:hypothetical protein [Microscilla marina]EAY23863.1 leucine-rich repeat containing protein [Microscilla marina ATCC 23134]
MEKQLRRVDTWIKSYKPDSSQELNPSLDDIKTELSLINVFDLTISMVEALGKTYKEDLVTLFTHLVSLNKLNIWGITEESGIMESIPFRCLSSVEYITFEACEFKTLPKEVYTLTTLKTLSIRYALSGNGISNKISELRRLTSLQIASDDLTHLPNNIGDLVNLKHLNIYAPKLFHIPDSIGNLTSLNSLHIYTGNFLPKSITTLTELETLYIDFFEEKSIISEKEFDTYLEEIILPLKQLKHFHIKSSALKKMPKWFHQFRNLETVSFAGLLDETVLPELLRGFKQLRSLRFTESYMTTVPPWVSELSRLEMLDFTSTNLTDLPKDITKLAYLKQLNLSLLFYMEDGVKEKIQEMLPNCEIIGL